MDRVVYPHLFFVGNLGMDPSTAAQPDGNANSGNGKYAEWNAYADTDLRASA
jgi:hypothetical protein